MPKRSAQAHSPVAQDVGVEAGVCLEFGVGVAAVAVDVAECGEESFCVAGDQRVAEFGFAGEVVVQARGRDLEAASHAGLDGRVRFEVAAAKQSTGAGYDLVTMFDCLHDMGDPVGASAHVLRALAPDGTWLLVEPYAGDRLEDNLTPVGRVFYGASTLVCTPASRDQEVGLALGAQAGEARLREVVTAGGFTRFRHATETPLNLVHLTFSEHDQLAVHTADPGAYAVSLILRMMKLAVLVKPFGWNSTPSVRSYVRGVAF